MKAKKQWLTVLFSIALSIALLFVCYSYHDSAADPYVLNQEEIQDLSDGWLQQQDGVKLSLPYSAGLTGQAPLVLAGLLPSYLPDFAVLCIETNYQYLTVTAGDTVLYASNENRLTIFGKPFYLTLHLVELPRDLQGSWLTFTTGTNAAEQNVGIRRLVLGNKSAVTIRLLREIAPELLYCVIIYLAGLFFLTVTFFFNKTSMAGSRAIFRNLGIFSLLAATWLLTDIKPLQLFFPRKEVAYLLSFCSMMLMPTAFLLFVRQICQRGKVGLDVLSYLTVFAFLLNLSLAAAGIASLAQTILLSHLLIAVTLIYVAVIGLLEYRNDRSTDLREIILGIFVLCCSAGISLVQYYFARPDDNANYAMVFKLGILVFIILLAVSAIRKSAAFYRGLTAAEIYRKMAFTDSMTNLGNRAAFEIDMSQRQKQPDASKSLAVAVFDMDNLKQSNDNFGHLAGDELICGFAACIQNVFQDYGTAYRIGGDEFAVILELQERAMPETLMLEFERRIRQYNASHLHPIRSSWGFAAAGQAQTEDVDLEQLFKKADQEMYRQKAKHKSDL
ncbi:MAG: GGDEF domain-containing protein [Negativicutes bacterium]|nr:GGDEF domain-containing protein [Negativicutes bacterium]